jgi:hypothetical protein
VFVDKGVESKLIFIDAIKTSTRIQMTRQIKKVTRDKEINKYHSGVDDSNNIIINNAENKTRLND